MPRVAQFYGIVIQMFHREPGPPHFHASYGEHEALIGIDPIAIILPARARRLVIEWAHIHQEELATNWQRALHRAELQRIDPLD